MGCPTGISETEAYTRSEFVSFEYNLIYNPTNKGILPQDSYIHVS